MVNYVLRINPDGYKYARKYSKTTLSAHAANTAQRLSVAITNELN